MNASRSIPKLLLGALLASWLGSASATTFTETLTANPADFYSGTIPFNGSLFSYKTLALDGMTPISAAVGDTINFDIMLATPFTLSGTGNPGPAYWNEYLLTTTGDGFPSDVVTGTDGTFKLLNGGSTVWSGGSGTGTSGQLALGATDTSTARTFNELQISMNVNNLVTANSVSLDQAQLTVYNVSPVPEPSTSVLMASGLLGLGWILRRQQRARVVA